VVKEKRNGDLKTIFNYQRFINRGRTSMLTTLRMLGAMGGILGGMGSALGMGMGGAVMASRGGTKVYGKRHYTPREWANVKSRRKMARESKRRNRRVG